MNALSTAKRTTLLLIALLLLLTSGNALARDDGHGYLGVMLQSITSSMAKALQLEAGEGVMINDVIKDGPAAASGLEAGDVILEFNGKAITGPQDLTKAVRTTAPDDKVDLLIIHNGTRQTAHIEMGTAKTKSFTYSFSSDDGDFDWHSENRDHGFMGVELDDLNAQLGEYFGVTDGKGALISKVSAESPAAKAGLKAGDVIVSLDGEDVDDSGDVHKTMGDTDPAQKIEVKVVRNGKQKTLKVTLSETPKGSGGPHMMHFGQDFDFPEDFHHEVRVTAPHGMGGRHELHEMLRSENEQDLTEVREELDQLRAELKELKSKLEK